MGHLAPACRNAFCALALPLLLMLLLSAPRPSAAATVVRHFPPESANDLRTEYRVRLLQLALQYRRDGQGQAVYRTQPAPVSMPQSRAALEMAQGRLIDVMWTMTTPERERELLPVRIPIDKGLLGWRIGLVREPDRELLADANDLQGLKQVTMAQGHDWPDLSILRGNGLHVDGTQTYDSTFQALAAGRFQYFPRSILEIWAEQGTWRNLRLVVEPHVALHYPAAEYFFVRADQVELAEAIRSGLEAALADGSFDRLFRQYFGDALERTQLARRRIIELQNPLAPALPLNRPELWFDPRR